jgi:hypothetical protein
MDKEVEMMRSIAVALAAFWLVSFGVFAQGSTTSGTTSGTNEATKSDTNTVSKKKSKKAKKKAKRAASKSSSDETPGGGARTGETPK